MKIRQTHELTEKQIAEIGGLMDACREEETSLSFPFEDGTSFYLLYDPALICALALTLPESKVQNLNAAAECAAFTRPDCRRRGYFSALFDEAQEEFEDIDLLFPVCQSCEAALKTMEALGAELDCEELLMELDPVSDGQTFTAIQNRISSRLFCAVTDEGAAAGAPKDIEFRFFLAAHETDSAPAPAGVCRFFLSGGADAACLHSFEILPELRGHGLGAQALSLVLGRSNTYGIKKLFLHVSGGNTPAVNLYKKAGFRITETLAYFLY